MSKIKENLCKSYKPEIMNCPFCKAKLVYKHAVSNKVIQFSNARFIRIKNLGYACPNCNNSHIYFSQTATKLAFKGSTYSAKTVCMIDYYKKNNYGREEICDLLTAKGLIISNRNIDIIYNKFEEVLNQDYDKIIKDAYQRMLDEYKEIRISVDLITINEVCYVILYDYFTSEKLAIWIFNGLEDPKLEEYLDEYISSKYNITVLVTIRNVSKFYSMVKKNLSSSTKIISFEKF